MSVHDLAGTKAPKDMLVDITALGDSYYGIHPDPSDRTQRVAFGTSGHRGTSFNGSFNEDHIKAITQSICDYRREFAITGPVFMGKDTHALSEHAFRTALEVLAANAVTVMIDENLGFTPTPVISRAVLEYNRSRKDGLADGIVITPSHNPPEDGGFKYNPPEGGPADTSTTAWIERRANELLAQGCACLRSIPYERALKAATTVRYDFLGLYVEGLSKVVDMELVSMAGLRLCADAMGGAGAAYWERIAERYGLKLDVLHAEPDPTFSFMTLDHDGRIRMDCSSPYAMAGLLELKGAYDLAFGNDPDFDRHGIVTASQGLMNPNHFLSAAASYLFGARPRWPSGAGVGKTIVSSSMIDRASELAGRHVYETPVGFKWFVEPLRSSRVAFACEESAGASLVCKDGSVWTTDKDGIVMALISCEMTASTGKDPSEHYRELERRFGGYAYERMDVPVTRARKELLAALTPSMMDMDELAGEKITAKLTRAPSNDAPIGGIKVVAPSGWFAVRPSGTEDIYKVYAESFRGPEHLRWIQKGAHEVLESIFARAGI